MLGCKAEDKPKKEHRPNILFAIADDQSYPYASAYGTKGIRTPFFDSVAKAGILFNNAFVAAPQCSPSRAAILTGKNIWQLEEAGTHGSYFPKKFTVFTDLLANAGYEVGFTGKSWGPGNWQDTGWSQNPVGPEFNDRKLESVPASGIDLTDYFGNFVNFFQKKKKEHPFFFWYGGHEPHRIYEEGSGLRAAKKLEEVLVPEFLPEHELIKSDIADYILEIEWFDVHLGKIIQFLKDSGDLDNTIIVVTSDNGMPFPSAKANIQEYGTHVPLAICWPSKMKGNRTVDDLVSLIDLTPTFLEVAGVETELEMTGKSLTGIFFPDTKSGSKEHREFVLTGRERHTDARPDNLGYPARAIRTRDYLYVRNFKPDLWPAGDPVPASAKNAVTPKGFKPLWPGFHDIDDSPSKLFLLAQGTQYPQQYGLAFDKRPEEQLYDIKRDPGCINNIAGELEYDKIKKDLRLKLDMELEKQGDPRVLGYGDIFDSYPRMGSMRKFLGFHERGEYNPAYIQKEQVLLK
ncbi:MAG TPA: sulfatase [Arenibacter sp.]|nr:sulfatase [Arenibacter sp.]